MILICYESFGWMDHYLYISWTRNRAAVFLLFFSFFFSFWEIIFIFLTHFAKAASRQSGCFQFIPAGQRLKFNFWPDGLARDVVVGTRPNRTEPQWQSARASPLADTRTQSLRSDRMNTVHTPRFDSDTRI